MFPRRHLAPTPVLSTSGVPAARQRRGTAPRLAAGAAAALCALALSACSAAGGSGAKSGSGGSGSGDDTTITFLTFETPNLTPAYWDAAIKRVTDKYPGMKVKRLVSPTADRTSYAKQLKASGQFPDVMIAVTPAGFAQAGDLYAWQGSDLGEFEVPDGGAIGGKVYQLPANTQTIPMVYYRKSMFAKAGIANPPPPTPSCSTTPPSSRPPGCCRSRSAAARTPSPRCCRCPRPSPPRSTGRTRTGWWSGTPTR
ncbi:extracellular solute-binding protein [Catenulispora yoronensis]